LDDALLHKARILIVDDEASHSDLLSDVLHINGYANIQSLCDPRGVLALMLEWQPDLIVLDLNMPYLDGFQVLELISSVQGEGDYLPILVNTADDTTEARQKALSGGAMDFLKKPFFAPEICLRITNLLRVRLQYRQILDRNRVLEEEVQHRTQELEGYQLELREAQLETIERLAKAAEHHDNETAQHTQRVALHCCMIGECLGIEETEANLLRKAAPLHDVGKIGIPDSILLKPGVFTSAERKIIQRHCVIGADLLSGGHSDLLKIAEDIALTHHEKWDGSGYPHGLSGQDIPVHGRILAVADVFDALTHARPYKNAWSVEDAVTEIKKQSGRHFDPDIVEAFLSLPHQELL